MTGRKKSREELDRLALARRLLELEPLGVLTREICPFPIPLDIEVGRGPWEAEKKSIGAIPPRLFYFPKYHALVHCYGEPEFYLTHPDYKEGELSKECYVLDEFPDFLSNQFALEDMLAPGLSAFPYADTLAMSARRPKPLTKEEQKERVREYGRRKRARCTVLSVVK